jgi:hypothetical protein
MRTSSEVSARFLHLPAVQPFNHSLTSIVVLLEHPQHCCFGLACDLIL